MAIAEVNLGTIPKGEGGDTPRSAMIKINSNFTNQSHAASRLVGTNLGNVMEVGAFGLGSSVVSNEDPDTFKTTRMGGVYIKTNSGHNVPRTYLTLSYSSENVFQMRARVDASTYAPEFRYLIPGNSWSAWQTFKTTQNTSIDSNGNIKAASPIVKLFDDKIELNDEAKEQINVTYEKLGTGNYLIKGSTGFAQEGWYIEAPKDANGNVLVAVVYEQLKNNDIRVKTYSKMVDKITGGVVPNTKEPKDIPPTRWIDVRLNKLPDIAV